MITLLTDFGSSDYFVAAVKGVILGINPHTTIIDITHEIPAQDIAAGAFTLGACYDNFPSGTIHRAVVDPGVGSSRRAIIVVAGKYFFVGPDNGIFNYIYIKEREVRVFEIANDSHFRHRVSPTFHGRDVFAPVAAWLSLGVAPDDFGDVVGDYVKFDLSRPRIDKENGTIQGQIIHIDRYGNCITNLTLADLSPDQPSPARKLTIGDALITQFVTHFDAADKNRPFAYPGSAGYWEIALWHDSAANLLGVQRGAEVIVSGCEKRERETYENSESR